MTQGVRDYILETSNVEKEEFLAFGNVEVKVVRPLPEDVSLAKVLHMLMLCIKMGFYMYLLTKIMKKI